VVKSFPGQVTSLSVLGPNDVWAFGGASGSEGAFHFNGHGWSRAAVGPAVINSAVTLASDGKGGLWMTSDTHQNYQVLLHYSAGQLVNASEPFMSVASIPGTAEAAARHATAAPPDGCSRTTRHVTTEALPDEAGHLI